VHGDQVGVAVAVCVAVGVAVVVGVGVGVGVGEAKRYPKGGVPLAPLPREGTRQ